MHAAFAFLRYNHNYKDDFNYITQTQNKEGNSEAMSCCTISIVSAITV
jgi:hypothetical protein